MPEKILIVEDQELVRGFLDAALTKKGYQTSLAEDGQAAVELLNTNGFDLVLSDVKMPRMDGNELLRYILGHQPLLPVILLTAFATIEHAVESMRNGAFDYLPKPITDLNHLEFIVKRALEYRRLLLENHELKQELGGEGRLDEMIGISPAMQHVFKKVRQAAPTAASVLITGSTGTGKELVARALHRGSPRTNGPFVQLNCAAVPESLIESELFGHKKGSFSGAIETTKGRFEAANGGTLLLDEIGDMPLQLQTKLLRALQERVIERVGSTEPIKVDVRVIATTHRDLEQSIAAGEFREDLYYRLNVIRIKMPVLADRKSDVLMLAYHFLRRFAKANGRPATRFSDASVKYLLSHSWPGNVRELENSIERAVILCENETIEPVDIIVDETDYILPEGDEPQSLKIDNQYSYGPMTLENVERKHILATLQANNGHRLKTAEALDISIRTLRNKLNQYRAEGEKIDGDDEE